MTICIRRFVSPGQTGFTHSSAKTLSCSCCDTPWDCLTYRTNRKNWTRHGIVTYSFLSYFSSYQRYLPLLPNFSLRLPFSDVSSIPPIDNQFASVSIQFLYHAFPLCFSFAFACYPRCYPDPQQSALYIENYITSSAFYPEVCGLGVRCLSLLLVHHSFSVSFISCLSPSIEALACLFLRTLLVILVADLSLILYILHGLTSPPLRSTIPYYT